MKSPFVAALLILLPALAAGQKETASVAGPDSVVIAAGKRYQGSGLSRFVFGATYRDLWATPIKVPVLDLRRFAGGLTPLKLGGGNQTKSLRLTTADGKEYVFRMVDKDKLSIPEGFQGTILETSARNEVSAHHPAAAMVAAPLLEAAGVLHVTPMLAVMPDDTLLGKFRKDFAGRLGMIERFPNTPDSAAGFLGAGEIIDSDELLEKISRDPGLNIDTRAFLKARLMDMFLNDWDRHGGQWKWARFDTAGESVWEPIPRDRDKPFISYGGVVKLAGMVEPSVIEFTPAYPGPRSLTINSLEFDRRLLQGIAKPVWDSLAQDLEQRLTDAVIDDAVAAMPVEYGDHGPWLAAILKLRRDQIGEVATRVYLFLASVEDLHATDEPDHASVTRRDDGTVEVALRSGDHSPYFRRRFEPGETKQIRLYLHEGDDTAVVVGSAERSIPLWIIGGNGDNLLIDSSRVHRKAHPTGLYDAGKVATVAYEPGDSAWNRLPWIKRAGKLVRPPKDRGGAMIPALGVTSEEDIGLLFRVGVSKDSYGFRKYPYGSRLGISGEYATRYQGYRVGVFADQRRESSALHFTEQARMSELEVINFHGLGNDTPDDKSDFYQVRQRQWQLYPSLGLSLGGHGDIFFGPVIQYTTTDSVPGRFLSAGRPYGFGNFGQAGLRMTLLADARDRPRDPRTGVIFEATGSWYPAVWDVADAFGSVTAAASTYFSIPIPIHPKLVLRTAAKKVFGDLPFEEAAFIGGRTTVRSLEPDRYAGDASLNGTAELQFSLFKFALLLPWNVGAFGYAEAGRVYLKGQSPGGWHATSGAGVWLGVLDAATAVGLELGRGGGLSGVRLRTGIIF